ncbi:MAG: hypothetical protein PHI58_07485, partial [Candidatus Omnitrophica bacterium]|nr:hypothetical protein [Candidatus Omnitrophota bacterium]
DPDKDKLRTIVAQRLAEAPAVSEKKPIAEEPVAQPKAAPVAAPVTPEAAKPLPEIAPVTEKTEAQPEAAPEAAKKPGFGIPWKPFGLALLFVIIMESVAQGAGKTAVSSSSISGWMSYSDMIGPALGWLSIVGVGVLLSVIAANYLWNITFDLRSAISENAANWQDAFKNIPNTLPSFISKMRNDFNYREINKLAEVYKAELDTFDEALQMEKGFTLRTPSQRPAAAIVALTGTNSAFGKLRTGGGKGYALFAGAYILLNRNVEAAEKLGVTPDRVKIFNPTNTAEIAARDAEQNARLTAKKKDGDLILKTGDNRRITIGLIIPDADGKDRGYIFDENGDRKDADVTDVLNRCDIIYATSDKFVHRLQNEQMGSEPKAILNSKWHIRADESDIMFEYGANTPFPIQGGESEEAGEVFSLRLRADSVADELVRTNRTDLCAEIRPESQVVTLNAKGKDEIKKRFGAKDQKELDKYVEYIESALIARWCTIPMRKDPESGKFVLVDEATGAPMPGRSLSRGLQTAAEIAAYRKEGALDSEIRSKVTREHGTMSMMTLDGAIESGCVIDFGGLSATHRTSFMKTRWNKTVYDIPSGMEEKRIFEDMTVCMTRNEGDSAVLDEIKKIRSGLSGMLLLAEDDSMVKYFRELVARLPESEQPNMSWVTSENPQDLKRIEKEGIKPGDLVIVTNIGGRAVDYAINNALAKSEGATALITYFADENTYEQFAGRVGRPRINDEGVREEGKGIVKEIVTLEDKLFRQYGKELAQAERERLGKGTSPAAARNIIKRVRDRIAKKQAFDSKKQQEFARAVEGYRTRLMNLRDNIKDNKIVGAYMDNLIMEFLTYAEHKQYELDRKLKDYKLRQFAEVEQFAEYVQLIDDKFNGILNNLSVKNKGYILGYIMADYLGSPDFNRIGAEVNNSLGELTARAALERPAGRRAAAIAGAGVLVTALSVAGVYVWNIAMGLVSANEVLGGQSEAYSTANYLLNYLSPDMVFIIGIIGAAAFVLFALVLKEGPVKKIASMDKTKRDLILSFKGIGNETLLRPLWAATAFFFQQIAFNAIASYLMPMLGGVLILTGAVLSAPVAIVIGSALTVSSVILTFLNIWLNRQ